MLRRSLLRSQIRSAWVGVIREVYPEQTISSERALQVHLVARLLHEFRDAGVNRRLFIEPKVSVDNGTARLHPDILVCNTRNVIGVIELKHQPHRRPNYTKDFNSLNSLAWQSEEIEIQNARYRGPSQGRQTYALASDAVFAWAGIYREPYEEISGDLLTNISRKQLMILHAVASIQSHTDIYQNARRIG